MTTLMKDRRKRGLDFEVEVPEALTPELLDLFASWPERFRSKVAIGAGCWEWQACKTKLGYGRITRGSRKAGVADAHRFGLELLGVDIPAGFHVDHLCRNTSCVRPDHLEPVAAGENIRRGRQSNNSGRCRSGRHEWIEENILTEAGDVKRCRPCRDEREREYRPAQGNAHADRTHCPQGHEYSPENTRVRKNGHRDCRECARIAARRHYWAKKEATSGAAV